jgi:hypothetical protein
MSEFHRLVEQQIPRLRRYARAQVRKSRARKSAAPPPRLRGRLGKRAKPFSKAQGRHCPGQAMWRMMWWLPS